MWPRSACRRMGLTAPPPGSHCMTSCTDPLPPAIPPLFTPALLLPLLRGSWDVLGIYPESTTPSGSFRDPQLVQAVTAHNTRAVALAPPRSSSTPAAAKAAAAPTPPAAMQAYSDNTQQAGK